MCLFTDQLPICWPYLPSRPYPAASNNHASYLLEIHLLPNQSFLSSFLSFSPLIRGYITPTWLFMTIRLVACIYCIFGNGTACECSPTSTLLLSGICALQFRFGSICYFFLYKPDWYATRIFSIPRLPFLLPSLLQILTFFYVLSTQNIPPNIENPKFLLTPPLCMYACMSVCLYACAWCHGNMPRSANSSLLTARTELVC